MRRLAAIYPGGDITAESSYDQPMTAEDLAKNIKVLIFDVDGVLTDGQIFVIPGPDGKGIESKGFAAHDGLGITLGRLGGLRIGIITKRNSQTVAIRARDLKLEFVYQGQAHKMNAIRDILAKTGYTIDQLAYVGDDIIDLPVMRQCGLSVATANARQQVKDVAHYITPNPGGQGAGRDAIDFILSAQGTLAQVIEQYLDEDNVAAETADVGVGNM
jgi:3-deoxy-D-manno-octulosonate 8-phosphate phosphatase (KDO 8-P phosphatase)